MVTLQNGISVSLKEEDGYKTDTVVINAPYEFIFYTRYDIYKATQSKVFKSHADYEFPPARDGNFAPYEWVEFCVKINDSNNTYVRINTGDLFNIASQGPNAGRDLNYNPVKVTTKSPLWPMTEKDNKIALQMLNAGVKPRYNFQLFPADEDLVSNSISITRTPVLPKNVKLFLTRYTPMELGEMDFNEITESLHTGQEVHHDLVTYYENFTNYNSLFFNYNSKMYYVNIGSVIEQNVSFMEREGLFNELPAVEMDNENVLKFLKYVFSIRRFDISDNERFREKINSLVAGEIKKMNKEEYRKELDAEVKERLQFDKETIRKEKEKVIREHREKRKDAERKIQAIEDELLKE